MLCDKGEVKGDAEFNGVTRSEKNKSTLLQTAKVVLPGKNGPVEANIRFGNGSNSSYATSKLIGKVRPKWIGSRKLSYSSFGSSCAGKEKVYNVFEINTNHEGGLKLPVTEVLIIYYMCVFV